MQAEPIEPIIDDGELQVREQPTALTAITRGEIDVQIATAKKYPRSVGQFKKRSFQLACLDEDTAATMFYSLPRGGKVIEGPSVRLAEVVGSSWGNLRYGARIVDVGDKFLTAQGVCHDLETNNAITVDITRRITDSKGRRYGDDMIAVTANAACSIALRQAIFKIVPFALVKDVYQAAVKTAIGNAESMAAKRAGFIAWFKQAGVSEQQVLAVLGRDSVIDVTMDDLRVMLGLKTAIKDGETTIEEVLKSAGAQVAGGKVRTSELNETNGNGNAAHAEPVVEAGKAAKAKKGSAADYKACMDLLSSGNQDKFDEGCNWVDTGEWSDEQRKNLRAFVQDAAKAMQQKQGSLV